MLDTNLSPLEILRSLGINGTPAITPAQGGFDTALWKVEYEGQTYALRVFRSGQHAGCEREQIVMAAARAAGLPVPEIYKSGVWQDRPVLLITWLPGRTVVEELQTRPWHLWRVGKAFGRMQAAIHAVPAPALLRQQPHAWISRSCEGEQALQDRLLQLAADKAALLHLDYHPLNVLTDGRQITGVIDWTNALAGDPRADAARTVSILLLDPLARQPLLRRLTLRLFELAWRVGYQRARGPLQDMPLFYAWAGTVLQQDQAHRYKHNLHLLMPAHRWAEKWKAHAGLPILSK